MNTARFPHIFRQFAAGALVAALLSPCLAGAISIGEIVMQSKLGEPLLAQAELTTAGSESVDESCLSLVAPNQQDDEAYSYLLKAKLAIKTEGARRFVVISSHKTFNELFAKLRLQVKCPGMGSFIKTLTILPDLDAISPGAIAAPATESPTTAEQATGGSGPAGIPDDSGNAQTENAAQRPARDENFARPTEKSTPKSASPARKRHAQTTRDKREHKAAFRLKLSGKPIDESHIGKISDEERDMLRARQKPLDVDDQMARFLALQNQVKLLQDELSEVKQRLASLNNNPAPPATTPTTPSPPAAGTPESTPVLADTKPAATTKKPPVTVQQDDTVLQRGLLIAGLVLLIAALLLLRRRQQAAKPGLAQAANTQAASPPAVASDTRIAAAPQRIIPKKSEEDLMLEEAELYALHGHPNKAIQILHEITGQNPAHIEARMLLISILSSLSRVEEFERAARNFLKYNKNSESWKVVQALGRTLDHDNPLYAGDSNLGMATPFLPQIVANKRRPVGDILIEMGVLSPEDMEYCLAEFNPKVHGRFGGYLVSRNIITLAQLNEALLKQSDTEANSTALPTLQDMESFLADYNPERDGSIGDFLVARKAITPGQLNKLQQQQSGGGNNTATTPTAQPAHPPASDKYEMLDLDLDKLHPH